MSKFDEGILLRAENFNTKSRVHQIKSRFFNQYEVNCK